MKASRERGMLGKLLWGMAALLLSSFCMGAMAGYGHPGEAVEAGERRLDINGAQLKVQVVSVDLNDPDVRLEVLLSHDAVGGAENFQDMLERHKPDAAINGNFFDAYASQEPYGTIVRNGDMVYLEGEQASLLATEDGGVGIHRLHAVLRGYLDGKRRNEWNVLTDAMEFNLFEVWYINALPTDSTGVYLYTPDRGESVMTAGGYAVEVIGGQVVRIYRPEGRMDIPSDGYVIYYARDAADENYVTSRFRAGRTIELIPAFKDNTEWDIGQVQQLVSAGPILVQGGEIVVQRELAFYNGLAAGKAQRSAAGRTADNRLLLVTGQATLQELAHIMLELGAVEAMNLDGGASSALFANGEMLTKPGRPLSTVLAVYAGDGGAAEQDRQTSQRIAEGAFGTVAAARAGVEELIRYTVRRFADVGGDDWFVQPVALLTGMGIVDGYADGTFRPGDPIQADAFIKLLVTALGHRPAPGTSYWAQPYLDVAMDLGLTRIGEIADYMKPIARGQMARMIVRAAGMAEVWEQLVKDDDAESAAMLLRDRLRGSIKDFAEVEEELREEVLEAYRLGIVTGFSDGAFGAGLNADRAAAATMILRLLDPGSRVIPGLD